MTEAEKGLEWIEAATNIHTNYPRMMSGPVEGKLLNLLTKISRSRNAIEIGTFTGYSAACIALALPEDGHLDTLEIDDELEDIIREGWRRCGVENRISLHIGDAAATLPSLKGPYDLAFIDADKDSYITYYEAIMPILSPGGLIVADDVQLGGRWTKALQEFNDHIKNDPRVEVVILPLRDGISIIRKKG